jgi:hypothetical protein
MESAELSHIAHHILPAVPEQDPRDNVRHSTSRMVVCKGLESRETIVHPHDLVVATAISNLGIPKLKLNTFKILGL